METVCFSETLSAYESTGRHNPEAQFNHRENLKYHLTVAPTRCWFILKLLGVGLQRFVANNALGEKRSVKRKLV
jgi:hypothetical protein